MAKPPVLKTPALTSMSPQEWQNIVEKKLKSLTEEGGPITQITCGFVGMAQTLRIEIHVRGTVFVFNVDNERKFWLVNPKGKPQKHPGFSGSSFLVFVERLVAP